MRKPTPGARWPSPHPPVVTVPAGPGYWVSPLIVDGFQMLSHGCTSLQ